MKRRIVRVDMTTFYKVGLPLGGCAFTSRIVSQKISPSAHPLGPENRLVIAPSLMLGVERAPICKGQGMPACNPRALKGNGVTYANLPMGLITPLAPVSLERPVQTFINLRARRNFPIPTG